jgi:hypothetical protein
MRFILLIGFAVLAGVIALIGRSVFRRMENSEGMSIRRMLPLILIMVVLIAGAAALSIYSLMNSDMLANADLRAQATQILGQTATALAGGDDPTQDPFALTATQLVAEATALVSVEDTDDTTADPFQQTATRLVATASQQAVIVVTATPVPPQSEIVVVPQGTPIPPVLTATQIVAQAQQTVDAAQLLLLSPTSPPIATDNPALNDPFVKTAVAIVEQITAQAEMPAAEETQHTSSPPPTATLVPEDSIFELTATALIVGATETQGAVLTEQAVQSVFPSELTAEVMEDATEEPADPFQLTATALVAGATETATVLE